MSKHVNSAHEAFTKNINSLESDEIHNEADEKILLYEGLIALTAAIKGIEDKLDRIEQKIKRY